MSAKRLGLLFLLEFLGMCGVAFAHPMGNFSVNHHSKIVLEADRARVEYTVDLAEIPTYQELQQGGIEAMPDATAARYVAKRGLDFGQELRLMLGDRSLPLKLRGSSVIFPPGAGGLPTMKMAFVYEAKFPAEMEGTSAGLRYVDGTFPGHTGWKEIIAVAAGGKLVRSSVPAVDRSSGLTNYPTDLLSSPPQVVEASLEVRVVSPTVVPAVRAAPAVRRPLGLGARAVLSEATPSTLERKSAAPAVLVPNRQSTPRSRFTDLITTQRLSPWFLFTAALIAMTLGALHALEPGHGKTIVAAYLIGSRGTARHAVLLGSVVTLSHTAGVFGLGLITLYASRYIVPEQLYPWLGILSGLTIAGLGISLFLRRATGTASDHSHLNEDAHRLWFFSKKPGAPPGPAKPPVSLTQLFTLGITGGIIPCPAALIVLLSAFALHRIAFGLFLIVAFSAGLAAVLVAFGLAMVYARRFMTHLELDGPLTTRWLPLASASFITALGLGIALQAAAAFHPHLPTLSTERLGPVLFVIGLGLILGMRHSTDADHVVAISTIVSRQRSIRNAALIGSVWGLGHTITIFVVGSLIILFGVEIPPRLGLSMEFCVAIMLIVLGLLNLTGVMQKITARFTSPGAADNEDWGSMLSRGNREALGSFHLFRPLLIGLVHGLAGSAAVALLVLSTIHDPGWATVYLIIFGMGTMVGMMGMTAAMALSLTYLGDRFAKAGSYLGVVSGMVSVCFGSFLVYQLGFLGGLFTRHPEWTPR